MDFDYTDLAMAVYNVAVVVSGGVLTITFGIESHVELVPAAVVVGLLWTLYYNYSMKSHLAEIRTGDLGPDIEEGDPADEDDEPTDEDEEPGRPDAPWE